MVRLKGALLFGLSLGMALPNLRAVRLPKLTATLLEALTTLNTTSVGKLVPKSDSISAQRHTLLSICMLAAPMATRLMRGQAYATSQYGEHENASPSNPAAGTGAAAGGIADTSIAWVEPNARSNPRSLCLPTKATPYALAAERQTLW